MLFSRVGLLLTALALTLFGCASEGVNLTRVHCRPIQAIGSFKGVAFGADIDTVGFAGRQIVYHVALLNSDGRTICSNDGRYQDSDGAVSASRTLMVLQSPQAFSNARLVIPADELEVYEDDLPVTAVFTLSLPDGTTLAQARRRVPLSQGTEELAYRPPSPEEAASPPEEPAFGESASEAPIADTESPAEPPPETPVADAEPPIADADSPPEPEFDGSSASSAPEHSSAETADSEAGDAASWAPGPGESPVTQPAKSVSAPEPPVAWSSSLSDEEVAAIAVMFHESLIEAGKSTENRRKSMVDAVASRPIMASAESNGAGRSGKTGRAGLHGLSSRPAKAAGKNGFVLHVVREGETLSSLAKKYYEDASLWTRVFDANRDILESPDLIRPGMELKVPIGEEASGRSGAKPD